MEKYKDFQTIVHTSFKWEKKNTHTHKNLNM